MKKKAPRIRHQATSWSIRVFLIFVIIGILAGIVDGIAYQVHLSKHGVGFFEIVPSAVFWSYFKTFPGNLITVLTFGPWVVAFVYMRIWAWFNENRHGK